MTMKRYEMCELSFSGPVLAENYASIDLRAVLSCGEEVHQVKGFYAGEGLYKVRFLPKSAGTYAYTVSGCVEASGEVTVKDGDSHGIVVAEGHHFRFEDGAPYYPFGTTVYALAHQEDALVEETMETLASAPFNKIRLCVFPKHYDYNHNEPKYYAFEKKEDGSWDVNRPCLAFWDDFEGKMCRLNAMGIQVDLILFHPYDRWGFAKLSQQDNLTYLDYLLRRFAAYPFFWWSMSNEYDLCSAKSIGDFEQIEEYITANDPYHHLLSNHNCFAPWDFTRPNITHVSYQTKSLFLVPQWYHHYGKPIMVDECCYEGNLPHYWGNITGEEMSSRFWSACIGGGYCTHGETFLSKESEIVWWARGGKLTGGSPARIAFLKDFVYSLPGPIEADVPQGVAFLTMERVQQMLPRIPEEARTFVMSAARMTDAERIGFLAGEHAFTSHVGDQVYLTYIDHFQPIEYPITLPEDRKFRVEVIDTWAMTRTTVLTGVSGKVTVPMPGKTMAAIAAFAE